MLADNSRSFPIGATGSPASSPVVPPIRCTRSIVDVIETNPVPKLVAAYRKLKEQRNAIDDQISLVKNDLLPAVEACGGKWTDAHGYARIIARSGSVSYPSADVDRLASTWAESEDPIMQACGKMLLDLRKEQAGYSYLQVK
jgi:hypothetical protein